MSCFRISPGLLGIATEPNVTWEISFAGFKMSAKRKGRVRLSESSRAGMGEPAS